MEKLICTGCGAPINPETLECNYCGSVFLSSRIEPKKNKKEAAVETPKISDADLINLIKHHLNDMGKGLIPGIIFLFIWTGIAFSIATSMFKSQIKMNGFYGENGFLTNFNLFESFFSIIPFLFAIIGVVLIIINFLKLPAIKWRKVYHLIEFRKYSEAYDEFKKLENKKHNPCNRYAQILIGYYRLNKFDEIRNMILEMPVTELSAMLHQNTVVLNIAESLGIKTPSCQLQNCVPHNNISIKFD